MRKSNVLPDAAGKLHHVVGQSDVELHEWGMLVHVKSTKTLQFKEYSLDIPVHRVNDRVFYVVSMLEQHIRDYLAPLDSPLFLRKTAHGLSPVLYGHLLLFIKNLASRVGLDQTKYGSHSMRRPGCAVVYELKVPLTDIMLLGDWSSMSVLLYLVRGDVKIPFLRPQTNHKG